MELAKKLLSATSNESVEEILKDLVNNTQKILESQKSKDFVIKTLDDMEKSSIVFSKEKRRIRRLKESLMQATVQAAAVVQPKVVSQQTPTFAKPPPAPPVLISVDEFLQRLHTATSLGAVENALNCFGDSSEVDPEKAVALKRALQTVVDNKDITNKVLRRRMSRLIFAVSSADEKKEIKSIVKVPQAPQPKSTKRIGSMAFAPPPPAVERIPITKWITDIQAVQSSADLEAVLQLINDDNVSGNRLDLISLLEELMKNVDLVPNAKMRRRVTRLQQTLASSNAGAEEGTARAASHEVISAGGSRTAAAAVALPSLQDSMDSISAAQTAEQLDQALVAIPWEGAQTASVADFETLKSQLLAALDNTTLVNNAKIRRRVKRMLELAEAKICPQSAAALADEGTERLQQPNAKRMKVEGSEVLENGAVVPISSSSLSEDSQSEKPQNPEMKSVPQVLFLGQLTFETTAEEVEAFLKQQGIFGPFSVRIPKDSVSKKSRGVAFVQFTDNRDVLKCLELHHAILNGRRINVEKTCGGRNVEARSLKLRQLRSDQKIAVSEHIDEILKNYEKKNVLVVREINDKLMNRLYALTPAHVTEVLDEFERFKSRFSKTPVTLGMLHKLVSAKDGGGSAVDQSKGLRFGTNLMMDSDKKRKVDESE